MTLENYPILHQSIGIIYTWFVMQSPDGWEQFCN